ncbi:MAG: hypothetical protein KAF91_32175 [Nostoc sp. TH1S01]|nr:hypothetical protein [Nostoc sp. TH1S01]
MIIPTQDNLPQYLLSFQNTIEVDLNLDELQIIDNYCQQTGRTYNEVIQQLVQQFLASQECT